MCDTQRRLDRSCRWWDTAVVIFNLHVCVWPALVLEVNTGFSVLLKMPWDSLYHHQELINHETSWWHIFTQSKNLRFMTSVWCILVAWLVLWDMFLLLVLESVLRIWTKGFGMQNAVMYQNLCQARKMETWGKQKWRFSAIWQVFESTL